MIIIDLEKKRMERRTMLAKIEDVLKRGRKDDAPAYTLVLGAGASSGVVPTAKEMLGFPDPKSGRVHDQSIPLWLERQLDSNSNFENDGKRLECSKAFWRRFASENGGMVEIDTTGLPKPTSIADAYKAIFNTSCIGGLDTPERHQSYMRAVTMAIEPNTTRLNATHFYLASLLSLQRRAGNLGSGKKLLYTGRREFARTIFTTNFDPLLQTSLQLFQLLYYMTDRPEFLSADALQTDHHPAIHLFYAHGSVHRPYLANTDEQIALLKQQNARDLAAYLGNHGVIVLGYSGWDDCLLEALNQTKSFSNNLYWLTRSGVGMSVNVETFLRTHPNAYWIEIEDGGAFMAELHNRLCPGAPNTELLYNPIRPLLAQLECVSLAGIQGGAQGERVILTQMQGGAQREQTTVLDTPGDVESIRNQVIARLKDAQKLFTEPSQISADPDEIERQAALSYANNDWDAAFNAYDRLLNENPGLTLERKALAIFRRGVCQSRRGAIDKAIEDYTSVIELPDAPVEHVASSLVNRGVCFRRKEEIERAAKDFTVVIEMPSVPIKHAVKARFQRAICFSISEDFDSQIADLTSIINIPGATVEDLAGAHFFRALTYAAKDERNKAIEDYTIAIELPNAPIESVARARIMRGLSYYALSQSDRAIADYSEVIHLNGCSIESIADARLNRGDCYRHMQHEDEAIAEYTALIELQGAPINSIAEARISRGKCYKEKHENQKALADYLAVVGMIDAPTKLVQNAKDLIVGFDAGPPVYL